MTPPLDHEHQMEYDEENAEYYCTVEGCPHTVSEDENDDQWEELDEEDPTDDDLGDLLEDVGVKLL